MLLCILNGGKNRGKMHGIIRDKRQILEREIATFSCKFASFLFLLFRAINVALDRFWI
jgi:hypothetical protein